jgi:hypothetical protein
MQSIESISSLNKILSPKTFKASQNSSLKYRPSNGSNLSISQKKGLVKRLSITSPKKYK